MPIKDRNRRRIYMKDYMREYRRKERELLRLAREYMKSLEIPTVKKRKRLI